MIEVKNVKKYSRKSAACILDHVDFKVRNRKIYGILGPMGAGKSTLLGIMAGVSLPTEGTVLINGYDIVLQPKEAKVHLGYLPEKLPLFLDMTPYEYLSFVAAAKGVTGDLLHAQVKEALAVTGLVTRQDQLIGRLSAGQRKCLAIAQTLMGSPDTLLLDEPLADLDGHQRNEIRELIRRLSLTKTVVLTGHVLSEMTELCDHIILLSEGRVVANDSPEALAELKPSFEDVFRAMTRQASEVPTVAFENEPMDAECIRPSHIEDEEET